MEETKWLTKWKIIVISIIILILSSIFIGVSIHKSNLKKEYIKFENNLVYAASNYMLKEKIELGENEWRKIDIKDIIRQKLVTFSRSTDCKGYVIAQASDKDTTTGNIENSYNAYIKCGKIYTSKNYGEKPSNKKMNKDKTQTENDTEKPKLELFGDKEITLTVGDKYTELGAIATDNVDGDITSKIKIKGKVDTKVAGEYTINYTVSDSSNNKSNVKRKIIVKTKEPEQKIEEPKNNQSSTSNVKPSPTPSTAPTIDTTNPIITFNNDSLYQTICTGNSVNISVNGPYGYVARDNVDGNITNRVQISGSTGVIYSPGEYTINYRVSDSAGNTSYSTKNFTVKNCNPTIPVHGSSIPVSSLGLTPNNTVVTVNTSFQLSLTINPSNATNKSVTYSSTNSSIVQVSSSGYVTANQVGTATIIVTASNGVRATCTVTVR